MTPTERLLDKVKRRLAKVEAENRTLKDQLVYERKEVQRLAKLLRP